MSFFNTCNDAKIGVRVPVGSSEPEKPPTDDVERFLALNALFYGIKRRKYGVIAKMGVRVL